jgi:hypothetical protein
MKKNLYLAMSTVLLCLGACKDDEEFEPQPTSNITVVHAALDAGPIKVNAGASSAFSWSKATAVAFGTSARYGNYTGTFPITVVSSTDTTKVLFNRTIDLKPINTLYIAGQSPAIDSIYRVESNFPFIQAADINAENAAYLRFVNLSPNSTPVNIKLTTATTNEVTGLAYKGISPWVKYPALTTTANYVFEIRNGTTNALIATVPALTSNNIRYKTISIIIRGLVGGTGTNAFGTFQVSYN